MDNDKEIIPFAINNVIKMMEEDFEKEAKRTHCFWCGKETGYVGVGFCDSCFAQYLEENSLKQKLKNIREIYNLIEYERDRLKELLERTFPRGSVVKIQYGNKEPWEAVSMGIAYSRWENLGCLKVKAKNGNFYKIHFKNIVES